jgi:glycosyltransferase involved in cell wall biosynthesis
VPEFVTDGANGILVAPEDVDALAGAMKRLATSAALRERLAVQGRLTAANLDWSNQAAKYLSIYSDLLCRAPRAI